MSFLQRLFGSAPAAPQLAPLDDPVLGRLVWDTDSEGWTGAITAPGVSARLYIGAGDAHEYPSEEMLNLLREPLRRFQQVARAALQYLLANADLEQWAARPEAFRVGGLESYANYLAEGAYTVTFTNGTSQAIWKVHFVGLKPQGHGVDG